tara:strand:+ start:169 stop:606 length:438 start_codon:yes stop_codon:yes gene_type:complete
MIKIYKIIDHTNNNIYIGSTKSKLKVRLYGHKWDAKNRKQPTQSCSIINNNNYSIELIEECNKNDRYEREQYWIDNTDCINRMNCKAKKTQKQIDSDYWYRHHDKNILKQRNKKEYQRSWGEPIDKLSRDTPNNLLLIQPDLFEI